MRYKLRLNEAQHTLLRSHLFPGDGNEAAALLVCGRRDGTSQHALTVQRVVPVPYSASTRSPDRVTWSTHVIDSLLPDVFGKRLAIVKVHSHPEGYRAFSSFDDTSDRMVFGAITSLLEDALPHASVIMLPDGEMLGRVVAGDGPMQALHSITVVGDDIRIWNAESSASVGAFAMRHAQAFGNGTIERLRHLSIAVIGCSGTGSIVIEQLARLGVGRLILVDPDRIEEKNLNRILNSWMEHAKAEQFKVHALEDAIRRMGLGTEVVALPMNLANREAVCAVAECDVAFGCMDGVEGRHLLNRLSTFYSMPYFDVGVRLDADGHGGIANISGAVHYLQPGRSSLLSRGVYSLDQVQAEEMRRTNPDLYERQRGEGYLRGVVEDRPAVISVNMFYAALAVNDFLARFHPYRNQANSEYAYLGASLAELQFYPEADGEDCTLLKRHVGRGDTTPLLERAALS